MKGTGTGNVTWQRRVARLFYLLPLAFLALFFFYPLVEIFSLSLAPEGKLAACRLSVEVGLLEEADAERAETLLGRFGLPTVMPTPIETAQITDSIRYDKKVRGGRAQFVVLAGVGRPIVRDDIPEALVTEAYESLLP